MAIDMDENLDEEGDAQMAAYGVLVAIQKLLEAPL